MSIVIEHRETGQTHTLEKLPNGAYPNIPQPWRVVGTSASIKRKTEFAIKKNQVKEKLAAMAVDFGLPISAFLSIGSWLLGCSYCALGDEIIRLYESGVIDRATHRELFLAVANAKDQKDETALAALKGKLEALRESR